MVQKLEEDLDSGRLAPAEPTPSPGAATPLGTPTPDGAAPDEPGVPRPNCCHGASIYTITLAMVDDEGAHALIWTCLPCWAEVLSMYDLRP